jgi:hypothetical protein
LHKTATLYFLILTTTNNLDIISSTSPDDLSGKTRDRIVGVHSIINELISGVKNGHYIAVPY